MTTSLSIRRASVMLTITTCNGCVSVKTADFCCKKIDMKFQREDSWLFRFFITKRDTIRIDWICERGCVRVGTPCFPSCYTPKDLQNNEQTEAHSSELSQEEN